MRYKIILFVLLPFLLLLPAGCGKTIQPKYYLLTPAAGDTAGGDQDPFLISLGPVNLPQYLDRSQIVTRRGDAELELADGHRWGEPLRENFSTVLAEDLRQRLHQARVVVFPTRAAADADYRVLVDVIRFDSDDRGNIVLTADWNIHDGESTAVIISKRTSYRTGVNNASGYAEIVGALSDTVGQLGDDIAAALTEVSQAR